MYTFHHVAITVSDIDLSIAFYRVFGFEPYLTWRSDDNSLSITHLMLGKFILELFCYQQNSADQPLVQDVGNDLPLRGVKHFALQVESLVEAKVHLARAGVEVGTEITVGRTGVSYLFLQDPDGIWVELVEDHRSAEALGISR